MGQDPRIAQEIATGLTEEQVLKAIEKVLQCYREEGKRGERLGKMIERTGIGVFKQALST